MIIRMLATAGELAGAAGLSQYPEFSQQYTQRLAGKVDELSLFVADFDRSAAAEGLTREAALGQMVGTAMVERRRADMERTIRRHQRMNAALADLQAATPMQRLALPHRLGDPETFAGTWASYAPAVPLTAPGAVSAAAGYAGGWLVVTRLLSLLIWPFRRRRSRPAGDQGGAA